MGIQNRSRQHIETKALSDIIRTPLIQSGKVDFVNESRREELLREQGYQLANCPPDARVHIGRQLGARYTLTGTLVEDRRRAPPQVRVSQQEDVYFLLTVEITDLETGLIAWTTQRERLRRASRPMVGW
jgi:PBP1b-binding outer membrane lipoprotein LpoB